jgi:hypothetical protein
MSDFFKMAFLIISGSFLFGIMVYVFYLGLKPQKKNPPADSKKVISAKSKAH